MRKSIQKIFFAGIMALSATSLCTSDAQAQVHRDKYWGHWDYPYLEQRGWSLGWNLGTSELWGDLGTYNVFEKYTNSNFTNDVFANLRGMGGMYAKYTHVPGFGVRIGVNHGKVYATDTWNYDKAMKSPTTTTDEYSRYLRNLDANTNIWEANVLLELAPLRTFSNWEFSKTAKMRFQPYFLLGASGFYFNPRGSFKEFDSEDEDSKKWVDLRELRTEGQGFVVEGSEYAKPYSVFSYAVAGGLGFKWDIGTGLSLGVEYLLRFTFTDYLDDVSGRYADINHRNIAFMNTGNTQTLSNRMSDKSQEIIPGQRFRNTEFRGNPDDKDKFSSISLNLNWKVKWRQIGWWNKRR